MPEETTTPPVDDPRLQALHSWLELELKGEPFELSPASADASFRRYFRVRQADDTCIVMDAPPEKEDSRPFIAVAALLEKAGLHGPQVLGSDLEQGFLRLTDLGSRQYMDALREADPEPLMQDAMQALVQWQLSSQADVLPPYDAALLQRELDLFPDWYIGRHLNRELTPDQRAAWQRACDRLVQSALAQPLVYVHRDYMPRNLMVSVPNPGIIDFQDAVYGPIAYDVLSLFKDAFISWPAEQVGHWRRSYHRAATAAGLPVGSADEFEQMFDWIGLQRHLKVLGIFARIRYRDGKPHYLQDAPRFIRYIREILPKYPQLMDLQVLFDDFGLEIPA